jgi:hypothetical protein
MIAAIEKGNGQERWPFLEVERHVEKYIVIRVSLILFI